jgi:ABC-type nitrate/sulfonate/bicarbonate transport system substrate-binding protein
MKKITILMLSMLVGIASCDKAQKTENTATAETQKELIKVSLVQEWFPNAGYAGELFAMNETDSTYKLDINLVAGSDNIDPVKLVMGGSSDFGVASADKILVANSKGADLVVVGVINYYSTR